jgi:predicted RNA-binding Zn-ribbon protein involved in translation (DUF1610 family)
MAARKVTDQQILEAWPKEPSITSLAARFGMAHRNLATRVKNLRAAGHDLDSPDRRSPNYAVDATKILLLDIETAPNIAYVWGLWKQNINPEFIAANGYVLCWTAKWLGSKEVMFKRIRKGKEASLLGPIHKLLDQAHAVIHYNGKKFDIPTLNKEFLTHGMSPPSPYKQVDLLQTMWSTFRFPSNKLDYIAQTLEIGEKLRHEGPQLWIGCMRDDPQSWKTMEAYNRHDVVLLEKLYLKLRPWIKGHPNIGAIAGVPACPNCGSEDFKRDQTHLAQVLKYERYQCNGCDTWFRGTKAVNPRKEQRFVGIA